MNTYLMFSRTSFRKRLLHFGVAVVLLLAQGLVVSHDHNLATDALGSKCEVCLQLSAHDGLVPDAMATVTADGIGPSLSVAVSFDQSRATYQPKPRGPPQAT
ncbi:MAG: hypothetical protein WD002_08435 [Pseudomonadales bacterium]